MFEQIGKVIVALRSKHLPFRPQKDVGVSLGEGGPKHINKALTQTIMISDSLNTTIVTQFKHLSRAPAAQATTITESLGNVIAKWRTVSQSITITDSAIIGSAKFGVLPTQSITMSDSVARLVTPGLPGSITDPPIVISEALSKSTTRARSMIEGITTDENLSRTVISAASGLGVKLLTFTKPTSGTPPVLQQSPNLAFVPKGAIAFHVSTSSTIYEEGFGFGVGFSDGTTHRCVGMTSEDNAGTSNTGKAERNSFVNIASSTSGTILDEATISFASNTVTLSWNTLSTNTATVFVFLFGGNDIQNVKVGDFTAATVTGNQTTTGISFTPDCELYMACDQMTNNVSLVHCPWHLGAARSSSKQWSICGNSEDAQGTSDTWRIQNTASCIMRLTNSTGAKVASASLTNFTSSGRTLNWDDADSAARLIYFMSIKGALLDIGSFTLSAGTGTQAVNGIGFQPKAILLASSGGSSSVTTAEAEHRASMGCGISSIEQGCVSAHDKDAEPTTVAGKRTFNSTRCLLLQTTAPTAASSITEVALELESMHSDGFNLNKVINTTILGNELIMYLAMGAVTPPVVTNYSFTDTSFTSLSFAVETSVVTSFSTTSFSPTSF